MKTSTPVITDAFRNRLTKEDRILVLGSCFAANVGNRLKDEGYDVCINPFGTLFNPASVASSLLRLASSQPFTEDECVQMGAGSELWCSFSHYTKFARPTKEEFLENANKALWEASSFFRNCTAVIITFGTAFVFEHSGGDAGNRGFIVSNCLKRPALEFRRFMLDRDEIVRMWEPLMDGILSGRKVIFTVSPIRHMADGAHGNQLSKATLLLSEDELVGKYANAEYFPSYEIVLDELRDYSWYADDLVHPSAEAVDRVWAKFRDSVL